MVYHATGSSVRSNRNTNERELVRPPEIRQLAEAMGCRTQRDFAKRLGVSQARMSQILSGASLEAGNVTHPRSIAAGTTRPAAENSERPNVSPDMRQHQ